MAKFKVKYAGLHKRDSYEGLIDYLENKQEKIKYPDREAKFIRDSPFYQQLLSDGFTGVEEQQLNKIKEQQEEQDVIRTADDTNETAKEVKVVAGTQTDKQLIVKTTSTGIQSQPSTKSSYSQSSQPTMQSSYSQSSQPSTRSTGSQSAQIFDMTLSDNIAKVKQDIQSVEDTQEKNRLQQAQRIANTLQNHLQNEATPQTTTDFAHKMALSGLSKLGSALIRGTANTMQKLASSYPEGSTRPDTTLLYGNPMGRQDFYTMAEPLGDKPKLIPIKFTAEHPTPQQAKPMQIDSAIEKSKPKAKATSNPTGMTVEEQHMFDEIYENAQAKPKPKLKVKAVKKTVDKPKADVTTGRNIPPSKIGIQKLREELESAKNKKLLSVADTSAYMQMYDNWKGAKGDKLKKYEIQKGIRDIYKRTIYKK